MGFIKEEATKNIFVASSLLCPIYKTKCIDCNREGEMYMKKINWSEVTKRMVIIAIVNMTIMFGATAIEALLVINEIITISAGEYIQVSVFLTAACIGCFISAKKAGHSKLIISVITATGIALPYLLLKLTLFSDCNFAIKWWIVLLIGVAAVAGVAASQKKARR